MAPRPPADSADPPGGQKAGGEQAGPRVETPKPGRLTRRQEFLAVAGTRRKWATPGLILQARPHDDRQAPRPGEAPVRVGFTASRKVGGAVERNRARRRLRAAVAEVLAPRAAPGHDFVLVARQETVRRPWDALKADLAEALRRMKLLRPEAKPAAAQPDASPPETEKSR